MRNTSFIQWMIGAFLLSGTVLAFNSTVQAGAPSEIDFEGLPTGSVSTLSKGSGISGNFSGSVDVFGSNPDIGGGATNAAVIFDSSNPTGGDFDLGTPNENFGGPGVGAGGESGPFINNKDLGNILIVDEDLVGPPDDADELGMFLDLDFSNKVTVNGFTVMDVEAEQGEAGTSAEFCEAGEDPDLDQCDLVSIPATGDNGVGTVNGIGLSNIVLIRFNLNGSGAIESILLNEKIQRDCWFTFGGWQVADIGKATFGGNVGPPSSGAIEVVDHDTGEKFHSNDVHITTCEEVELSGPEQPGANKGLTVNKANFEGTGRYYNGTTWDAGPFPFTGYVIDAGEPGGKQGNDSDAFVILVDLGGGASFQVAGDLESGNVQIHPPVPNK